MYTLSCAHCKTECEIQGNGFQVIKKQSDCFMRRRLTGLLEHLLPKCSDPGQLSAPSKELGTAGPETREPLAEQGQWEAHSQSHRTGHLIDLGLHGDARLHTHVNVTPPMYFIFDVSIPCSIKSKFRKKKAC